MNRPVILSKYLRKVFETESRDYSEWFGYYNYDTLNHDVSKMIAGRIVSDGVAPSKDEKVSLGYYDLKSGRWNRIGETDSWNWQQGAMCQWLQSGNQQDSIIFNCSDGEKLFAKIYNINTGEQRTIDWPIYGITSDGKKSISLDLERSYWCRAYHYQSVINKEKDGLIWQKDGIYEIDILRNTKRTLIDIDTIIHVDYKDSFKNCKHWLEHVMVNPSGTRFCFLHRFSSPDNVLRYSTRLFVANADGSHLSLIPGWEDNIYTHFGWQSDDEFAIYTYTPYKIHEGPGFRELIKNKRILSKDMFFRIILSFSAVFPYWIRTRMVGRRSYYQFYQLDSKNNPTPSGKAEGRLYRVDGHPSFTADGRYMITDSYPWKDGYQRLMVYDTQTRKSLVLARLNAYYRGNPASCDLHPKLCKDNRFLVVDTAFDEHHHMLMFELDWNLIKKTIS